MLLGVRLWVLLIFELSSLLLSTVEDHKFFCVLLVLHAELFSNLDETS